MADMTHIPVLVAPILEAFRTTAGETFLDATVGSGGHSRAILAEFPNAKLWAIDRDGEALERSGHVLPADRVTFARENFCRLDRLSQKTFDGILLDLGVSSDQLDASARGFSFRLDGPLDMRMDQSQGKTAAQFLEEATHGELVRAIRDWGEEPHWRRAVATIEEFRGTEKLQRTAAFADLMHRVLPAAYRTKIDSVTRVFQGIRIAVNGELDALEEALPKAFSALKKGGTLAVISFHSLEDRIVKRYFREWGGLAVDRSDGRYADERAVRGEVLTAKPITPTSEEQIRNPRSRSAKLRLFRRTEGGA
ncbi:MAG: 16S rRNA (cytosine(1402)-N(4))-methyltransferase RsmH [Puniceicoccales bacterium]|jgi:16S rRNA (cytosine1402-N4)-methyltransferase|nr:16S rRNA (cytosine(1402)-N(4))-methyltransferase RsmH [Puniceicoccales bacterium]